MKKLVFAFLLIAGKAAIAQEEIIEHPQKHYSMTDAFFPESRMPETARFVVLLKGSSPMTIQLKFLQQLDSIPNLDSLVRQIWSELQNFSDSLQDPLVSRRIDYVVGSTDNMIRLRQYPQNGTIYNLKDGQITQLKVEQDTLKIHLYTSHFEKNPSWNGSITDRYYISIMLNHITDLPSVLDSGQLQKGIDMIKRDLNQHRDLLDKRVGSRFNGYYSVNNDKVIESVLHGMGKKKYTFMFPVAQMGLQYVNGYWAPSLGLGMQLTKRKEKRSSYSEESDETNYMLLWEPYFFFQSDSAKSFRVMRNDFISFRYHGATTFTSQSSTIHFRQTASVGYLVRRKGDFMQPVTFKFTLPGLQTKSILLEPEFVFNEFFKNFSPSLKLVYFFGED